jgi:coenzyme F420-dependent glucose-6-phosphate dehydrogenase
MAGDLGDGFLTVFETPERVHEELQPALATGVEKSDRNDTVEEVPKCIHVHVSYDAESEEAAMQPCLPWRGTQLPVFFSEDISDPRYIQSHGDKVDPSVMKDNPGFVVTTDPQDIVDETRRYVEAGFDEIVFQSHSPDQQAFADLVAQQVIPEFA